MVFYSKQIKNDDVYYKVQGAEYHFDYASGTEIGSEELEFDRYVSSNEEKKRQEVVYESKTYASNINGRIRVTTRDKARFKNPHYKYHVVTYDELSLAEYRDLRAVRKNFDGVKVGTSKYAAVYFHLQTGGFSCNDDILQISMKSGTCEFDSYIDPTQDVSEPARYHNGLTANGDDLFLVDERVKSLPLELVLLKILYYLQSFDRKVILVGHNTFGFDMPRLLRAIEKFSLLAEFDEVIEGFCDMMTLFKEKFPNRPNGYNFAALTDDFGIAYDDNILNNSKVDVRALERLTKAAFNLKEVGKSYKQLDDCLSSFHRNESAREIKPSCAPMSKVISKRMINRLARARISYDDIVDTFTNEGEHETVSLLRQEVNSNSVINNILQYLRANYEEYEDSDDSDVYSSYYYYL